ncbi:cupin domain-containing protein [Nocardia tengchongensis]|uniref:cupin domain-containing protein n=1 Tax=Nocardia tengchongensis TaxID=2055889 RepID=UPI0036964281
MQITPIDLFARGVRMLADGHVFDEERRMTGDIEGWTVATFHVESEADVHGDHWERHPASSELVTVLSGSIRLYLRPETPQQDEDWVCVQPGTAYVVPRGRWHRIEVAEPADLVTISLRRDSELTPRR